MGRAESAGFGTSTNGQTWFPVLDAPHTQPNRLVYNLTCTNNSSGERTAMAERSSWMCNCCPEPKHPLHVFGGCPCYSFKNHDRDSKDDTRWYWWEGCIGPMCVYPVAYAAVRKELTGPQNCCPGGDNADAERQASSIYCFFQCCLGIPCQPLCGTYVRTKLGQNCILAFLMETICAPVVCAPCAMGRFLKNTDKAKFSGITGADDTSTDALLL